MHLVAAKLKELSVLIPAFLFQKEFVLEMLKMLPKDLHNGYCVWVTQEWTAFIFSVEGHIPFGIIY